MTAGYLGKADQASGPDALCGSQSGNSLLYNNYAMTAPFIRPIRHHPLSHEVDGPGVTPDHRPRFGNTHRTPLAHPLRNWVRKDRRGHGVVRTGPRLGDGLQRSRLGYPRASQAIGDAIPHSKPRTVHRIVNSICFRRARLTVQASKSVRREWAWRDLCRLLCQIKPRPSRTPVRVTFTKFSDNVLVDTTKC